RTPPQEREAGTRPRALVLGRGVGSRSDGLIATYRAVSSAFRWLDCDVPGCRYRVPMASCDVPAREDRGRTRPSRVSDRHDRAWTARHAVPIAPSARGRVLVGFEGT